MKISSKRDATASFYIAAENCILITKYIGADPGSQHAGGIPILKRFSLGFKLNIN